MSEIKRLYKDTKVKASAVVDDNGEIIEIKNSNLMQRTTTGEISISSSEYVYLDTQKLSLLLNIKKIKQVDLALIVSLSTDLLLNHNICMIDDDKPHTTSSIAKLAGCTNQAVKLKLNRLIDLGLLHYGVISSKKRLGKVYVLNPYLIRKGRKLAGYLTELFDDIS